MKFLDLTEDIVYFDVECDGLQPTIVWCVVCKERRTGKIHRLVSTEQIRRFFHEHKQSVFVAHNGVSFDRPVLERLCGCRILHCVDTLLLSQLYNPNLEGGHSLEAYGERLKFPKGTHNDWSQLSIEMLDYCERDVLLLEKVHEALVRRVKKIGFSEFSIQLEHDIRQIIDEQERNGVWFDVRRAEHLRTVLEQRLSDLSEEVLRVFPPTLEAVATYPFRRKKDGGHFKSYESHLQKYHEVRHNDDDTYTVFEWKPFNLGSSQQRLGRLLQLGFQPTKKTPKGNPSVDEDSLVAFAESSNNDSVRALANWLVVRGRLNALAGNPKTGAQGWLDFVKEDGRIHGKVITIISSRRMAHNSPNLANVPSALNKAQYGEECRGLFGVQPGQGRVLLGYDASGLEARGLCHFINQPEATKILLEGDVHQINSEALTARLGFQVIRGGGGAKTLFYAFIYGARPPKLGAILRQSSSVGDIVAEVLGSTTPGLGDAIRRAQQEWVMNDGLLQCVDGGYVRCPSRSAALNYKVQPLGAVVMKVTAVMVDNWIRKNGIDAYKVLDVHDESQFDVAEDQAEALGLAAVDKMTQAGQLLKLNVPIIGQYKTGQTWAETH